MISEHNISVKELARTKEEEFNKELQGVKIMTALLIAPLFLAIGVMIGANLERMIG